MLQGQVGIRYLNKILTGNPKFEINTLLNEGTFEKLLFSFVEFEKEEKEDFEEKKGEEKETEEELELKEKLKVFEVQNDLDERVQVFLELFEKALSATPPPFDKDLENEKYKYLVQKMKTFDPNK